MNKHAITHAYKSTQDSIFYVISDTRMFYDEGKFFPHVKCFGISE